MLYISSIQQVCRSCYRSQNPGIVLKILLSFLVSFSKSCYRSQNPVIVLKILVSFSKSGQSTVMLLRGIYGKIIQFQYSWSQMMKIKGMVFAFLAPHRWTMWLNIRKCNMYTSTSKKSQVAYVLTFPLPSFHHICMLTETSQHTMYLIFRTDPYSLKMTIKI